MRKTTGVIRGTGLVVGVCLVLALAVIPAEAGATLRYATPGGGGGAHQPCPQNDPCNLITALTGTGTNGVHDGDQVIVGPGHYTPGEELDITKSIDVGGATGAPLPRIDGAGDPGTGVGGITTKVPGINLHDLQIHQTTNDWALILDRGSLNTTVNRVYVSDPYPAYGACVLAGSSGALVRNTVCMGAGDGIYAIDDAFVASPATATLRNVTAAGGSDGLDVRSYNDQVTVTAVNVIAHGSLDDVSATIAPPNGTSATVNLSHSNYHTIDDVETGANITAAGTNSNQTAVPQFVDLADGDFHQLPSSPTIDAGQAGGGIGTLDLDGNPRVQPGCVGGAPIPDIGAYELAPASSCGITTAHYNVTLGALRLNKKKGTATLAVDVPGPGLLAASGKGLKATSMSSTAAGTVVLNLRASGKARNKLTQRGKVKLNTTLSWAPTVGSPSTQTYKLKLVKK